MKDPREFLVNWKLSQDFETKKDAISWWTLLGRKNILVEHKHGISR